jgi:hypothetical protein
MGYKKSSGFKMYGKSPLMKKLIGNQHKLPEHLKQKIEASPLQKKGPCWEGYEMIGMKDKGGRQVPNCVPKK